MNRRVTATKDVWELHFTIDSVEMIMRLEREVDALWHLKELTRVLGAGESTLPWMQEYCPHLQGVVTGVSCVYHVKTTTERITL